MEDRRSDGHAMSFEQPLENRASAPALELRGICKSFGSNRALDDASIAVDWGEVHAVLGENGAGKSTIMNVASGIYAADEGQILIDGETARIQNPLDATRYGIGMVHQHFRLVRNFTVAQNILLACEGRDVGIRTIRDASREVAAMGERVGLRADPAVPVARLSVAEQQQVEILKVLLLGARIVILDEPTAVLTEQEAESVLAFVRNLARRGHAVVLITHKLREVTGSSDRVTVMRHGKVILNAVEAPGLSADDLARAMVGERDRDGESPERGWDARTPADCRPQCPGSPWGERCRSVRPRPHRVRRRGAGRRRSQR